MWQSGLAVQEIVNLNYGDVREQLEDGTLPIFLRLVRQKTGSDFKTFFGRDAVHYLKLYLSTRKNLKDASPLFTMWGSEKRISTTAIQQRFNQLSQHLSFIKKSDLENSYSPCRPHSLRSGFRSRLTGRVSDDVIQFWLGHTLNGTKSAYFNLPEEDLRELYMDAEKYLCIERTSRDELVEKQGKETHLSKMAEQKISGFQQTVLALQHHLGKQEKRISMFREDFLKKLDEQQKSEWTGSADLREIDYLKEDIKKIK